MEQKVYSILQSEAIVPPDLDAFRASERFRKLDIDQHYKPFIKRSLVGKVILTRRSKVDREIEEIYHSVLAYFAATVKNDGVFARERDWIGSIWPTIDLKLRKCPGLRSFMREYGVYSRGFLTFLLDIPKGLAMLPAYGLMRTLGGRICAIPEDDTLFRFAVDDRVFSAARLRCGFAQYFLRRANRPVMLGAGLLPELWMYQYPLEELGQQIVAYDSDNSLWGSVTQLINPDFFASDDDCVPLIDYRFATIDQAFRDYGGASEKPDLVVALGVGSYYRDNLDWLIGGMASMIGLGGKIVISFETMVEEYAFDLLVLGWSGDQRLKPFKNADEAVMTVSAVASKFGLELKRAETDGRKPSSAGIVMMLEKTKVVFDR